MTCFLKKLAEERTVFAVLKMLSKPDHWSDDEILQRIREANPLGKRATNVDKIIVPDEIYANVPIARLWPIINKFQKIWIKARINSAADGLALRLAARGYPKLFDYIRQTGQFPVGDEHHTVRLLDFGTESLVFLGKDSEGSSVAIKVAFVDFTDLAHLDLEQLSRRRNRLNHESQMLNVLADTVLPAFISKQVANNPLFPQRMPLFLRESEQFLIMEYVEGIRADEFTRGLLREERSCCTLRLATEFAVTFFELSQTITSRIGPAAAYTDIKPENVIIQASRMRVVDASSIVEDINVARVFSVSEGYLDPIDHQRWMVGKLVPDNEFVLRSVVRVMHALVSNEALFVGKSPSWPSGTLKDFVATFDGLIADSRNDIRFASDICRGLLSRLQCEHGTGVVRPETDAQKSTLHADA